MVQDGFRIEALNFVNISQFASRFYQAIIDFFELTFGFLVRYGFDVGDSRLKLKRKNSATERCSKFRTVPKLNRCRSNQLNLLV